MKIDIDKTYRTKCGYPVRLYTIYEEQDYQVHGAYQTEDGVWRPNAWRLNGCIYNPSDPCSYDLVEVRPERVVWINEYENGYLTAQDTEEAANVLSNYSSSRRIALHRVVLNEDTVWQADADQADAEKERDDE